MTRNEFLNKIIKVDWVVDEDGDLVCRLWGFIGIGHYKWQDGAIFCNARGMRKVKKRGITCEADDT